MEGGGSKRVRLLTVFLMNNNNYNGTQVNSKRWKKRDMLSFEVVSPDGQLFLFWELGQ